MTTDDTAAKYLAERKGTIKVRFSIEATVMGATDLSDLEDRLFDFFASDPDDLFPEMETVYNPDLTTLGGEKREIRGAQGSPEGDDGGWA